MERYCNLKTKTKSKSMEFLPKEIIQLEILPWLPVKPLTRFKCVSKEWYSLINGITFINLHRKRTLESPTFDDMILVVPYTLEVRVYTHFDNAPQTRHNGTQLHGGPAIVVGCCNGLICLELAHGRFSLFDPLTNKNTNYGLIPRLGVTWSTHKESQEYGFGYDDIGHVYKIVSIRTCFQGQERMLVANVFSTSTYCWEAVIVPSSYTYLFCPGVYINNKLQWIVNTDNDHGCIVTFDLHTQVFGEMTFPKINNGIGCDLMGMGRFLCLYMQIHEHSKPDYSFGELWVMKKYGVAKSWIKLHVFSNCWIPKWLIAFKPKEEAMLTTFCSKLTWFGLKEKSMTDLDGGTRYDRLRNRYAKPWMCVKTLASTTLFRTSTPTSSRFT